MRTLRVILFVIVAAALAAIGIAPRKIFAGPQTRQVAQQSSKHRHGGQRGSAQVTSIKPQGVPGATGLVAIPQLTDDKQIPTTGGPSYSIPLINESTTNTITISSVTNDPTVDTTHAFTVTTNCESLPPGASCDIFVKFVPPATCVGTEGLPLQAAILVANNDPILDGSNLEVDIQGWGSDGNFQFKNLTDPTLTPDQLAAQLVGSGITVSNVKYTGAAVAAGTFTSSTNIIGFKNGIILSSGSIRNVVGPNCSTGIDARNGTAGDPDLDVILAPGSSVSHDAAVLEFDFVPTTSTLKFQYVFASDEYNEFVGDFNDVFAFFLNGNNIALLPGVTPPTPVSINTVNLGANSQFFINNNALFPATTNVDTEMDGLTTVFTATAQVNAGQTNHIKLAIADAADDALDSNVFIEAGSFTSATIELNPTSVDFGNQSAGTTSAPQPIVLTNSGDTSVTITSITASAGFGETDNCVGAVPAGATCTIQATFSPTSATAFTGTISINDNAAGSPQTVTLTGTGTSSGVTLTSITVTPNPATVAVGGTLAFTATGHFSDNSTKDVTAQSVWHSSDTETATIASTTGVATGVAVGGPVTITATDTPAGGTAVAGTAQLTVSNFPVKLTIQPPPGGVFGPVAPGGTLAVGVLLNANPGFTGTVTFTCATSSPTITCIPNPNSITIGPNGPLQVAIVVDTFCKGFTAPMGVNPGGFGSGLALLLLSMALGGVAWTYRQNPRWVLSFVVLILIAMGGAACNSVPRGPNGATAPGNYTLTITATVNGQSQTVGPVNFTVN